MLVLMILDGLHADLREVHDAVGETDAEEEDGAAG